MPFLDRIPKYMPFLTVNVDVFSTQTEINQMRQTGNHFIMHILQEGIVLFKWEEEITSPFS